MAGRFYLEVVQVVLLFGSETWVLTPQLDKSLKDFHHRESQQMEGMGPKFHQYGTWVYPPIRESLTMVVLD